MRELLREIAEEDYGEDNDEEYDEQEVEEVDEDLRFEETSSIYEHAGVPENLEQGSVQDLIAYIESLNHEEVEN